MLITSKGGYQQLKQLKSENERLLKKVGQLTLENDFFAAACEEGGRLNGFKRTGPTDSE